MHGEQEARTTEEIELDLVAFVEGAAEVFGFVKACIGEGLEDFSAIFGAVCIVLPAIIRAEGLSERDNGAFDEWIGDVDASASGFDEEVEDVGGEEGIALCARPIAVQAFRVDDGGEVLDGGTGSLLCALVVEAGEGVTAHGLFEDEEGEGLADALLGTSEGIIEQFFHCGDGADRFRAGGCDDLDATATGADIFRPSLGEGEGCGEGGNELFFDKIDAFVVGLDGEGLGEGVLFFVAFALEAHGDLGLFLVACGDVEGEGGGGGFLFVELERALCFAEDMETFGLDGDRCCAAVAFGNAGDPARGESVAGASKARESGLDHHGQIDE